MSSTNFETLHTSAAMDALAIISGEGGQIHFVGIGRNLPWSNDPTPDLPNTDIQQINSAWWDLMGGKQVTGNDTVFVIPRINWTNNTVYIQYDDTNQNLFGNNFYVLTSTFNLYKCLWNNGGANSTVMPTYTDPTRTNTTIDGYTWKYLLTLNQTYQNRFLNAGWIPVSTLIINDGSLQWVAQSDAVDGAINIVLVDNSGTNYQNAANLSVSIVGDGVGWSGIANINSVTNTVSTITTVNPGSGYTRASVFISDAAGVNGGFGANARAIIPPSGGHGSDPINELGASNIMINIQLEESENGSLTVDNEYRQIILIRDPLAYNTTSIFAETDFSQTTKVSVVPGAGSYSLNEFVYQGANVAFGTFSGAVADWDGANNILSLVRVNGTLSGNSIVGVSSGLSRTAILPVVPPTLEPYSGVMLYIDNISPVSRAPDQTESISIVMNF